MVKDQGYGLGRHVSDVTTIGAYADWGRLIFFFGGAIVTGHRTQLTIAITDSATTM